MSLEKFTVFFLTSETGDKNMQINFLIHNFCLEHNFFSQMHRMIEVFQKGQKIISGYF